jgi:hypothetical protein
MTLGLHSDEVALREEPDHYKLGWERVPIVFEYRYLGALMNSYSNTRNIVGDRVKKVGDPLKRSTRC